MESPRNDAVSLESAEKIILRWDSTASEHARDHMIFQSDRQEIDLYLQAVDELQTLTKDDQFHSNSTLSVAMTRLADEFRNLLLSHASPVDTQLLTTVPDNETTRVDDDEADADDDNDDEGNKLTSELKHEENGSSRCKSSNSIREIDLIPSDTIHDLRSIAKRMISCGHVHECVEVYSSARKLAVDASFRKLGVEDLSMTEVQRLEWETLEMKIRQWLRAAKVCVRVVFASEKKLSEQIFDGLLCRDVNDDECFVETIKGYAIQLFNFAEAISTSRRSPEKLFKMLDIHDCLSELLPDIKIVLESESLESVRVQGLEILSRLGKAVRGILSEFEDMVVNEPSRVPVPGGTIHPLTRYVMNYISLISDYKQTLIELIDSEPVTESRYGDHDGDDPNSPEMDFIGLEGKGALELHLIWIIVILQFNLEGKSRYYRDASLAHVFMMNNVHYIVQKAKGLPELREMIGDGYLKKLTAKYRMAATNYRRSTWMRVLHCLRDEGLYVSGSISSGVSRSALRERFKTFNTMFEELHRTQAMWLVPDAQLREELRISTSDLLIPAYRAFFGRFRHHIESGRHPENYLKFSVEDLESAILDFFEGYPVSQHLRRRISH